MVQWGRATANSPGRAALSPDWHGDSQTARLTGWAGVCPIALRARSEIRRRLCGSGSGVVSFDEVLHQSWHDRMATDFLYRGMSSADLQDGLDPGRDPFASIRPRLLVAIDSLQRVVAGGVELILTEEHFGTVYRIKLSDILCWTTRDLVDTGIDFTSHHQTAREYADCFHGSQLKQNLRTITRELPNRRGDPGVRDVMTSGEWDVWAEIGDWVSATVPDHRPIVLWARRSLPAFEDGSPCLLVGGFERFRERVADLLDTKKLPRTAAGIAAVLPATDAAMPACAARCR